MPDDPRSEPRPSPDPPGGPPSLRTAQPEATASRSPAPPGFVPPFLTPGLRPLPEYELLDPLGRGSFGEVWKARGPGGFDVALKFIRLGDEAGKVELRALELMKGIRHAHLLPLFGAWQRADLLIIAMELAERTLYQRWKEAHEQGQPGIPAPELLEYMREAAKGLDYLNENSHAVAGGRVGGIQHKDVKPQNLLLVGGTVKVGDFGLARLLERTVTAASGSMTPAYTAPEFLRGQATRWSDQYCLAVTYCQLRGGRLPFEGGAPEVMAGHALYAPDLSMVPEAERPAVGRALAKEPEQRWPSCREFVRALATTADPGRITFSLPPGAAPPAAALSAVAALPDLIAATRPAPRRAGRGQWVAAAAGALLVLALVALGIRSRPGRSGPQDRPSASDDAVAAATVPAADPPPTAPAEPPSPPESPRPKVVAHAAITPPEGTTPATRRIEKPKPALPPPPPAAVHIAPLTPLTVETGKSAALEVHVRRENGTGPVRLEVEGLPAGLHALPASVEAGQDTARLEIQAEEDAETGPAVARLRARLGDTQTEQELRLFVRTGVGLRLFPPGPVVLEAGQTRTLVVRLERRRVAGPVAVRLDDLPAGAACRPITIALGDVGGRLEVETSADAPPARRSARLVAEIAASARAEAPLPFTIGPPRPFKVRLAEDTDACRRHPEDPVVWLNRGHTYRAAGEADKARADYSHAIRLDDSYAPAYYYRGRAYEDEKRPDRARQDYDEAIRLDGTYAPAYLQRGLLRRAAGDTEGAVADYGRALELDPNFTAAYLARADAWKAMKLYDRALADYDRALQREPGSATAYFDRGVIHHLLKQDVQAIADYDEALRRGPKLAAIYFQRGNAWKARKDPAKALTDYDEAIRLDRGFGAAYYSRGRLYEEMGDADRARADLDRARRLGVESE